MKRLAATLDAVRAERSKKRKVALLAELWSDLSEPALACAARLVLGQLLPSDDPRTVGIGWALACSVAASLTHRSEREVAEKSRELGDFGDALAVLLPTPSDATTLTLDELPALLDAIAATADRVEKQRLLEALFRRTTSAEARYLGKALLGELRIGVQRGLFEESLAVSFGRPLEAVRKAAALTIDCGALAVLAKTNRLEQVSVRVGVPIAFMLATPSEEVRQPVEPAMTAVEDKLDGVRAQAHVRGGTVQLFSRGHGEVTNAFPEVVVALAQVPRAVILDGEIIAIGDDERPRPFQALQARLGRGRVTKAAARGTPVRFVAFDCLYADGSLLESAWSERRRVLETLGVTVNPHRPLATETPLEAAIDEAFTQARARGNEGLMLKRIDSPYEAGARGAAWRKVKRAFATLDVVITRAEQGHGRRAGVLSDYTFAVWKGAKLLEIGRAYSGLTDVEIDALSKRLDGLTVSRDGPVRLVEPVIVLEVAFDGLQRSPRHASGFALRFPRIVRIRDDKRAGEADQLDTVTALWRAQLDSGHREEKDEPQLSLFE